MKKELNSKEYVMHADKLLKTMAVVVSNLAFNAAGLGKGEEAHRKKLLKSVVYMRLQVEYFLSELSDKDEVGQVEREIAREILDELFARPSEKGGE